MSDETLDDKMAKEETKLAAPSAEESSYKQNFLEKIVNGAIDVGFMALAAKYYLTSTLLSFTGFSIADIVMKKKAGEKIGFFGFFKLLYNNAADAATNGCAQEEAYKKIDFISNNTLLGKVIKSLTFTTFAGTAYQLYYQGQQYIRGRIGYCKAIGALFNWKKGKEYMKDFYETKIKGQFWGKAGSILKKIALIHFASVNYITSIPARMGIAAGNDVIFAYTSKPEKKKAYQPQPAY